MDAQRRWYDQEPACGRLIEQVRVIPQREVREFCGQIIGQFAEQVRKQLHQKGKRGLGVSSIGAPAISSLYRFGYQKRRWYDEEPTLHKMVAILYTLPLEGMAAVGFQLGDALGLIQIYASVCHQVDEAPNMKEMLRICKTSLQAGKKEAEDVLVSIIGKELYESLSPAYMNRPDPLAG